MSEDMVGHIIEIIKSVTEDLNDRAWWMGGSNGEFTVKSTYHILRHKRDKRDWMSCIWIKDLPFKISFFLWRVWKEKIITDDNLKRMKMQIASKCYCCEEGEMETMKHLLLTIPIAQRLWKQFASCAGFNIDGLQLQQVFLNGGSMKQTLSYNML